MRRYQVLIIGVLSAVATVSGIHVQKERALTGARYAPVKVEVKDNRDCVENDYFKFCKTIKPFTGKLTALN